MPPAQVVVKPQLYQLKPTSYDNITIHFSFPSLHTHTYIFKLNYISFSYLKLFLMQMTFFSDTLSSMNFFTNIAASMEVPLMP